MTAGRSAARNARLTLIKLAIFTTVMVLVLAGLVMVFSEYRSGASEKFNAVFTDVSGLESGDKVRIAGVEVGRVDRIALADGNTAAVRFSVAGNQVVHASTEAMVRYENLTGDRYLELNRGGGSVSARGGRDAADLADLPGPGSRCLARRVPSAVPRVGPRPGQPTVGVDRQGVPG